MSEATAAGLLRRGAVHGALALAGFLAVAAAFRSLIPWPEEYGLRAKWEYFRAHRDEFDAVFLGSSRFFRSIDPLVVDAELERRGIPMRSFNFGVGGMRAFEQDFVLHRLLELEPARLRWVFLEGGPFDPEFGYSFNAFSWRSVFWHSLPQTLKVLEVVPASGSSARERWRLARTHVELWLSKLSSYGQGRALAAEVLGRSADTRGRSLSPEELAAGLGFEAADAEPERATTEAHRALVEDPGPFLAHVRRIEAENRASVDPRRAPLRTLEAQYRAADRHHVRLVYLVPPGYEGTPLRPELFRRGLVRELLDFNRPDAYPELFTPRSRFDAKHLNREGAEAFSRLLAGAIADELERGGGAAEARGARAGGGH